MNINLHEHFEEGMEKLPLNKIENDRIVKIILVAILEGSIACEEYDTIKCVNYHSGFEIQLPDDETIPIPADIFEKILEAIQKVKQCKDSLAFGDLNLDEENPVRVEVNINSLSNTYSQTVCENCVASIIDWIRDVCLDIYGEASEFVLCDFDEQMIKRRKHHLMEKAANVLKISIKEAYEHSMLVRDGELLYVWDPARGGLSVIYNSDGERLVATSRVTIDQIIEDFENGKRS